MGYGRTSFARIAERAGLSSTGLISYHFSSKDELMEQIVVEVYTRGAQFVLPRIQAEASAAAMLRAYILSNLEFIARNRTEIAAVIEVVSNLRKPDGTLRFDASSDQASLHGTEWILKKGQADGDFRAFDTRVMALAIRAVIDRSSLYFQAFPDLDWNSYALELASIFDNATRRVDAAASREEDDE